MPPTIERNSLIRLFGKFGTIRNVFLLFGKGIAFIEYSRNVEADAAIIEMNGFPMNGMILRKKRGKRGIGKTHKPFYAPIFDHYEIPN